MKNILIIILLFSIVSNAQSVLPDTVYFPSGGISTKVLQYRNTNTLTGAMLLASKTGISGASLATTDLDFASGIALSTHTPIFCVIKYSSGTIGISAIRIKTAGGYLIAATALLGLTATDDNFIMQLAGVVRNTGNVSAEITTASLGASSIAVYVYGVKKN